jgi:group I intron endonuclease
MPKGIIYCAHCIPTGKKYIGKTLKCLERRKSSHKSAAKYEKRNLKFYNAIKKYGWNSFIWGVIEECDVELLNEQEVFWIDKYNTYYKGYNSTLGGDATNPTCFKKFKFKSPSGEILEGENIAEFCRNYNLSSSSMGCVLSGKRKSHKGWTLPETKVYGYELRTLKIEREFTIQSPDGTIIAGKNVTKFCNQYNLNPASIINVLNGKYKSYKKWKLTKTNLISHKSRIEKISKEFVIMSPDQTIIKEKNIKEFSKKYNLIPGEISRVLSKKIKSHRGWKLPTIDTNQNVSWD